MLLLFRSFSNTPYIYDSNTNDMFNIDENVYEKLQEVNGHISELKDEKIKKSCEEAGITDSILPLQDPELFKKDMEEMNLGFTKLTLGITHSCNLRCSYCIYSGTFQDERTHESKHMSREMADKIIDTFFIKTEEPEKQPQVVIFYGGEPFMNFPVLKHVTERVKRLNEKTGFSVTTNGMMLKKADILDFIVKNNFLMNISFDGPVQDRVRIDEKGNGTFNALISILESIKEKYPEYYEKNIGFNVTVTPATDLPETVAFFHSNPLFKNKNLNVIRHYDPDNAFCRKYDLMENQELLKGDFEKLRKEYPEIYKENPSFHNGCYLSSMVQVNQRAMGNRGFLPLNSCCYPGLNTVFVDINGNCFACERTEHAPVGHIDKKPVDDEIVEKYVKTYYDIASKHCPQCWASHLCSKCYSHVKRGEVTEKNFLEYCDSFRKSVKSSLELFATIKEKDETAFDDIKVITSIND
ncbi:MAG: radical SAM protein [Candidatus Eremiobacterota bacterium]